MVGFSKGCRGEDRGESNGWHRADYRGMSEQKSIVPIERIERMVIFLRNRRVMLDFDLAEVYGVKRGG